MRINRVRVLGLVLVVTGVLLPVLFESDVTDFITGLCIGAGIVFAITGRIISKKQLKKE